MAWGSLYRYSRFLPRLSIRVQPLLSKFSAQHISSDGLPIYRRLQSDDQDSVRLLTIEDLIVIVQRMSPNEVKEQLLKPIRSSIGDKSWRVRYMVATHFNEVSKLAPTLVCVGLPFMLVVGGRRK